MTPVPTTVLPALVVWFVLLSPAHRFRVLDHLLGIDALPRARPGAPRG
ncbi:hypothetical protein I4I73_15875 [Pseudonocardia sp. KRD-184]|uniref:Uncharacterized protein n=1 Tax=Pseudonocardia oceani TaxID=2792013 RepID=A0ABS6U801_9PSEU|nr:hypothetical protein [Pseudonocardia oceani]MBW0090254.1 hypothetical protein [Pseudonocardia oceani]MBW0097460.1 hypothetical protein [Pseudonocardia oceani]MBW0109695.1 hypothetical protein [Pseudonocardia oceani]MBW0122052.1 hypothetical protein [Pseudonocardia oceani]MBW0128352.1 hypothetical protein [Pseudonocardia oceani]